MQIPVLNQMKIQFSNPEMSGNASRGGGLSADQFRLLQLPSQTMAQKWFGNPKPCLDLRSQNIAALYTVYLQM